MDVSKRFVRVLGHRRGLIEFSFAIGDPDVCVDLLMTPPDFQAFCRDQGVRMPEPVDPARPESILPLSHRDDS
jgi:phenol hydroxylase P0 protein